MAHSTTWLAVAVEQRVQARALPGVERAEDVVLGLRERRLGLREAIDARRRQRDDVPPAVLG